VFMHTPKALYRVIAKYAVCCGFVAILSQNLRFPQANKDHIRPPQSHNLLQFAVICNNVPKKKFPDVMGLRRLISIVKTQYILRKTHFWVNKKPLRET